MAEKKQNCWEHLNCGREVRGKKVSELGLCSAAVDNSYNGINSGINGGRICWAVAGTLCGGEVQGSFAEKRTSCIDCDFFQAGPGGRREFKQAEQVFKVYFRQSGKDACQRNEL